MTGAAAAFVQNRLVARYAVSAARDEVVVLVLGSVGFWELLVLPVVPLSVGRPLLLRLLDRWVTVSIRVLF